MKNSPYKFVLALVILVMVASCARGSTTPTATLAPVAGQSLPNTGQQITPLAAQGSGFENLNPGLDDNPDWLAGQAVTSVVSPDKKTVPPPDLRASTLVFKVFSCSAEMDARSA